MAQDIFAGTIGGVAGIAACQPFDTVKVRLQTAESAVYRGLVHCATRITAQEGFLALYKGLLAPVVSNAPINAIVFGAERSIMRHLAQDSYGLDATIQHMVAGSAAGFMQSFISCPAELVKVRMQVDRGHGKTRVYNGAWDCFRVLLKRGGLSGAYRGFWLTAARDTPAFGIYFWTYDTCLEWYRKRAAQRLGVDTVSNMELGNTPLLMSGGIAGTMSWALLHPIDVLKSLVQAAPDHLPKQERSVYQLAKAGYQREGIPFFFRGYWATVFRAFPASAVTFLVYEWTLHGIAALDKKRAT